MKNLLPELRRSVFFPVLLSLLLAGCYNPLDPTRNQKNTIESIKEANAIALCLSGTIIAPDSLFQRVYADLSAIRSCFAGEFEQLNTIWFRAPWLPSCTVVLFEPDTSKLVANGQYKAWDELNKKYQVSGINLRSIAYNSAVLSFKGQLHPRHLSESYRALPGVRFAHPNYYIGDGPMVYPSGQETSEMTYLFRNGWGDCPAGCIFSEFWYFVSDGAGRIRFIGHWDPSLDRNEPDWWANAKLNIELYRTF